MATLEEEIKGLKEKNNELVQKVQFWKMTAAEKENDKLNLMKEMNELRLKLSRLRNSGGSEALKLDTALQQHSEQAISHLVKASAEIAKSMEIAKAYIRDRQELDMQSPRWSTLGGTPSTEKKDKVHRVPPMMIGGQSIQPVVALSRTLMNTSNPRTGSRSPNQNRNITSRALPMHMLQDVYIPLTRIDVSELQNNNMETDAEVNNADNSTEDLGLDDSQERSDESDQISEGDEDDDDEFSGRKLHALSEEMSDIEEDIEAPRLTLHIDNPLEGPSWLLDSPPNSRSSNRRRAANLEPDSTTELDKTSNTPTRNQSTDKENSSVSLLRLSCEFSPTVRRRKRTSSPPVATPHQNHYSPRPSSSRKNGINGRVLKVLVSKLRLDGSDEGGGEGDGGGSPPKRARSPARDSLLTFDAPSPNGATDAGVIVSERTHPLDKEIRTEVFANRGESRSRLNSQDSRENHRRRPSQENRELTQGVRSRLNSQDSHRSRVMSQDRDSVQHSRVGSNESRDSDSGSGGHGDSISEGRTRRPRKMVTYKEKPLNRKLRR